MVKQIVFMSAAMLSSFAVFAAEGMSVPNNLVISGIQYSPQSSYTYAGLLQTANGNPVGEGLYYKTIASYLTYRYNTTVNNAPVQITGSSPGLDVGAGYAWKGAGYTMDLSAAIGYRQMRVTPVVPANEKTGSVFSLTPQFQGSVALTNEIDVSTIANYTFGQQVAYARGRLITKLPASWFGGVETIYQKGKNYRINQTGLVVGKNLADGYAVDLSAGRSKQRGGDTSTYVAVSLSRVF